MEHGWTVRGQAAPATFNVQRSLGDGRSTNNHFTVYLSEVLIGISVYRYRCSTLLVYHCTLTDAQWFSTHFCWYLPLLVGNNWRNIMVQNCLGATLMEVWKGRNYSKYLMKIIYLDRDLYRASMALILAQTFLLGWLNNNNIPALQVCKTHGLLEDRFPTLSFAIFFQFRTYTWLKSFRTKFVYFSLSRPALFLEITSLTWHNHLTLCLLIIPLKL